MMTTSARHLVPRSSGSGESLRFAIGESSLGAVLVAASEHGVCAILIGRDAEALLRDMQDRFPKAHLIGGDADCECGLALVVGFVQAPGSGLNLPLDMRGTVFQQRVWTALTKIPAGRTMTYTQVANALAVIIPCHRVVRQDGSLSGYRWGVQRKRALLDLEASAAYQ